MLQCSELDGGDVRGLSRDVLKLLEVGRPVSFDDRVDSHDFNVVLWGESEVGWTDVAVVDAVLREVGEDCESRCCDIPEFRFVVGDVVASSGEGEKVMGCFWSEGNCFEV